MVFGQKQPKIVPNPSPPTISLLWGIGVWNYQLRMGEEGIDDGVDEVRRMRYREEMMYWFGV